MWVREQGLVSIVKIHITLFRSRFKRELLDNAGIGGCEGGLGVCANCSVTKSERVGKSNSIPEYTKVRSRRGTALSY